MSDMTETAQELGPMPDTIHCWHGQFPLSHTGTWATTRYPVDAVHYTRTSTLPVEHKPSEELVAALAREAALRTALEWYEEQARLCRLVHSGGDPARKALNNDGGCQARSVLGGNQ